MLIFSPRGSVGLLCRRLGLIRGTTQNFGKLNDLFFKMVCQPPLQEVSLLCRRLGLMQEANTKCWEATCALQTLCELG